MQIQEKRTYIVKKIKLGLIVTIHDIGPIMVCMLKSKIIYMQLSTERKASIN